jgi:hypothetical protein
MAPPDPATLNPDTMGYRELQKACKAIGLPARGTTQTLRKAIQDYVNDAEGFAERLRLSKEEKKARERQAKAQWVDWKNHAAREILMEDLERGGWLYGLDEDARVVFDTYKTKQEEFKDIPFDQFEVRYKEATKKAAKRRARSAEEEEWLDRDRLLHPRQSHNHQGEPVFDMDIPAKAQLQADIKNKLHKRMTPMELWEYRQVYAKYKLDKFRPRIYQEIRRVKMLTWLDKKRTEKRTEYTVKKAATVTYKRN